jgi:hypothetical protein
LEPVGVALPPPGLDSAYDAVPNKEPVIKALLPVTIIASAPKVPSFTESSEDTSSTVFPEDFFIENSEPDAMSDIVNNPTCEPDTLISTEPEPCTISPFLTLNSFAIIYSFFHFPKGILINIVLKIFF